MPFQPGHKLSGKGQAAKKKHKHIRDLLLHLSPRCAVVLEEMLSDPEHQEFAVKTILERIYGKAPQELNLGEESRAAMVAVLQIAASKKPEAK